MSPAATPMIFNQFGPTEMLLVLLVLVLLFGAKKLPELARGSGRALRIFKSETKDLVDGNDDDNKTPEQKQNEAVRRADAKPTESPAREPRSDER